MDIQKTLQILLEEFRDKLETIKNSVVRDAHFYQAENKIKVAIGMRRSGKTFFLYQHIQTLLQKGIPLSRILYLNFEDDRLFPLERETLSQLIDAFYTRYPENHDIKCYLFLDEVQNVPDWPIVIRRFHDTKNVEIFLTGSSAKLLSKEIATSLRGRSLATEIWPFSFQEFLRAKKITLDLTLFGKKTMDHLNKAFHDYLSEGGFPELITYDTNTRQKTLQEYTDVTLYRDIIERHAIKHPSIIKYMVISMLHNVSSPFAINKLYNELKTRGFKINKDILYDYASHIEDAYITCFVPIFERSLRKIQTSPQKIYAVDPGLVRATTWDYTSDLGKLFENIVYLDLRRLSYKIEYYTTKEQYEIDFLITNPQGKQKLVQVVWDIENEKTRSRETRALNAAQKELGIDGEIITLESYLQYGIIPF